MPFSTMRTDHCTADGARALAERIRSYWKERGHYVEVGVETGVDRYGNYMPCVRSNLLNGLPREVKP